jgi:hypothetical protein
MYVSQKRRDSNRKRLQCSQQPTANHEKLSLCMYHRKKDLQLMLNIVLVKNISTCRFKMHSKKKKKNSSETQKRNKDSIYIIKIMSDVAKQVQLRHNVHVGEVKAEAESKRKKNTLWNLISSLHH